MRSLPRSSSTNASTGAMPGGQSGAQRVLALVDEEARALALLGLAERARRLDVAVGAARDHAGIPLSAATGAQAGCARDGLDPVLAAAAWPPSAPAWCRRQSDGIAAQSASVRRSEARVAAVAEQPRERLEPRLDARDRRRHVVRAAAPPRRCRGAGASRRRARRPRARPGAASSRRRPAASRRGARSRAAAGSRSLAALAGSQVAQDRVRLGQHARRRRSASECRRPGSRA